MLPGVQEIKDDVYANWLASDGLMMLDPGDHQASFQGSPYPNTVHNENGILFLTVFYLLCKIAQAVDVRDFTNFAKAHNALIVPGHPGLTNRHFGDPMLDSADNYAARVLGGVIFDIPIAEFICAESPFIGLFNNTRPHWPSLAAIRQPGEMAFYRLCAGRETSGLSLAWFCAGTEIMLNKTADYGGMQLSWVRMQALRYKLVRNEIPTDAQPTIAKLSENWDREMLSQYGTPLGFLSKYYAPGHPIVRLATLIWGRQ